VILRQHHRSLSAEQMDARFVERVERAFQNGSESSVGRNEWCERVAGALDTGRMLALTAAVLVEVVTRHAISAAVQIAGHQATKQRTSIFGGRERRSSPGTETVRRRLA
jgi:hypothetical protein